MTAQPQIQALLQKWIAAAQGGHSIPVGELCRDCPELLPEVERQIAQLIAGRANRNASLAETASPSAALPAEGQEGTAVNRPHSPNSTPTVELDGYPSSLGGYSLGRILGEGGMGRVYEATDSVLKRKIAIKVMRPDVATNVDNRERFLREARAVAALEHDRIIAIHQVGEENQIPFLVMPFLKGEPLESRLKRDGALPLKTTLRLAREMAEGLATAHEIGLVHRDIKPANVWLEGDRARVKILDFGLARGNQEDEKELTQSGAVMGTPMYMAPEQANGEKVDSRADLFSLGCVIYRMLSGSRPFDGGSIFAIMAALSSHQPKPLVEVVPGTPKALSDLVETLLSKRPEGRPRNTWDVVNSLRTIEESLLAPTATPSPLVAMALPADDPWSHIDDDTEVVDSKPSAKSQPASPPSSGKGKNKLLVAGLGGFLLLLVGFIIIKITNKDGSVTEIKLPDDTKSIEVEKDGKSVAKADLTKELPKVVEPKKEPPRVVEAKKVAPKPIEPAKELPVDYAKERQVAERLLKLGKGRFDLVNKTGQGIGPLKEPLPNEEFTIASAYWSTTDAQDDDLALLADCTRLEELRLSAAPRLTPAGLKALGRKPSVRRIWIDTTIIPEPFTLMTDNFPSVNHLALNFCDPSTSRDYSLLKGLQQLQRLSIESPNSKFVDDLTLGQVVAGVPDLRSFTLLTLGAKVTLKPLEGATRLQILRLRGEFLANPENVLSLTKLPHLERLQLDQPNDDRTVSNLGPLLSQVRFLDLISYHENDPGISLGGWKPFFSGRSPVELVIRGGAHVLDGETFLKFATLKNLKRFVFLPSKPELCTYTAADVAEFRRLRPDMALELKGYTFPALTDWPGKFEGSATIELRKMPKDSPPLAVAPLTPEQAKAQQETWAKYLKQSVEVENKIGMKFRLIPPTEMVETRTGQAALVRIDSPFFLGTTEVTYAQFKRFVEETGYKTVAELKGGGVFADNPFGDWQRLFPEYIWRTPGPYPVGESDPVIQVSRIDAQAFCDWLSRSEEGVVYRLPTAAEWDWARSGGGKFANGHCDKDADLGEFAWLREAFKFPLGKDRSPLHPVGTRKPNPFGLYDMLGNVWEIVYGASPEEFRSNRGVVIDERRGGSWSLTTILNLRGYQSHSPERRAHDIGFRVLRQTTNEPLPKFGDKPVLVARNSPLSPSATVARPEPLPGVRSWSVEPAGYGGGYYRTTWSSHGDLIATASADGIARVWDRSGNLKRALPRMSGPSGLSPIQFSPDGSLLAVTNAIPNGGANLLQLWSVSDGKCKAVFPLRNAPRAISFSPSGKEIGVAGYNGLAELLNLETGQGETIPTEVIHLRDLCWSRDGNTVWLVYESGRVQAFDPKTRLPIGQPLRLSEPGDWSMGGAVSPDGNRMSATTFRKRTGKTLLESWDTKTGKPSTEVEIPFMGLLRWHPTERRVLVSPHEHGSSLFVLDPDMGKVLYTVPQDYPGSSASWSPDGKEFCDVSAGRLRFFDAATGKPLRQGPAMGMADGGFDSMTLDGNRILTATREFDATTGDLLAEKPVPPGEVVLRSPRGDWRVYLGGKETEAVLERTVDRSAVPLPVPLKSRSWKSDSTGESLAAIFGNQVVVWDAKTGQKRCVLDHSSEVGQLVWSPEGKQLATWAKDGLRIWEIPAAKVVWSLSEFPKEYGSIAEPGPLYWGQDGRILRSIRAGKVLRIDLDLGPKVAQFNSPGSALNSLTLSPHGARILFNTSELRTYVQDGDQTALLGSGLHTPDSDKQFWHPDGRRFVGSDGMGVKGVDARRRERLGTLWPQVGDKHWLCVGPEGHYRGSAGVEESLVYVAQMDDGSHQSFTPKEFAEKFGWKNDPAKARLMKLGDD